MGGKLSWFELAVLGAVCFGAADLACTQLICGLADAPAPAPPRPVVARTQTASVPANPPGWVGDPSESQHYGSAGQVESGAGGGERGPSRRVQSQPKPLPLLSGTLTTGRTTLAMFEMPEGTRTVRVGDHLDCEFVVNRIDPRGVTLKRPDGSKVRVHLGPPLASFQRPGGPSPSTTLSSPARGGTLPGLPGHVSRRDLCRQLDSAASWAQDMQLEAASSRTGTPGLRIRYSERDNPLAALGIGSGDILMSVNQKPVKSPEDLSWVFSDLREERKLELQVERFGLTTPLTVDVDEAN